MFGIAVIDQGVAAHLRQRGTMIIDQEKRRYPRKKVSLPAFIVAPRSHAVHPATIQDISYGGVRIIVSKESGAEMRHFDPQIHLSVFVALPQETASLAMKCMPSRIQDAEDRIEVGAFFTGFDMTCSQMLANFLVQ